jgi:hypothetical protein
MKIYRSLKLLILFLSLALTVFLTGCSEIEGIATTPDGRVLLLKETANDLTSVMECLEDNGDPPELSCRPYKITTRN